MKWKNLYNKIRKKFKENKYKQFFTYFNSWLGKAIPKIIWKFSELIKNEKNTKNFIIQIIYSKILIDILIEI